MGKAIMYRTNCHKSLKAKYLSLATDPAGAGLLDILCCLLCLLRSLVLDSRLLDGGFLLILGRAHCLLPLGFSNLGLLVPLRHDVLQGSSNDGTLELLGTTGPLLGHILLKTLLVLPAVENGPGDLPGVPLQHMRLVGAGRQELVALAIGLDQGAAMARVDLVARVAAQVDLHPNPLLLLLRSVIKLFKLGRLWAL